MIMKLVIGFVFATALATSAAAFEGCGSHSKVVASAPATPVQTAEAPSTTQTK